MERMTTQDQKTVTVRLPSGNVLSLSGVVAASTGLREEDQMPGVVVQYQEQPHEEEPTVEFIEHGKILEVIPESAETLTDDFRELSS